jgi:flagellar L-ring protein precursor FlgH
MKRTLVAITLLISAGCSYPQVQLPKDTADQEHIPAPQVSYANGSIWQASSVSPMDDFKARTRHSVQSVCRVVTDYKRLRGSSSPAPAETFRRETK